MVLTEQYLEKVLESRIQMGLKGRESSKSHLKSALYDWRVENHWTSDHAIVLDVDKKAFAFVTFTKQR